MDHFVVHRDAGLGGEGWRVALAIAAEQPGRAMRIEHLGNGAVDVEGRCAGDAEAVRGFERFDDHLAGSATALDLIGGLDPDGRP